MSREYLSRFIGERIKEPMLEIGPYLRPYISKDVFDVCYADIRTKDEIYEYYKTHNLHGGDMPYELIADIDYVIEDTYESAVGGRKFALVFSSNVLEHVNDVIAHLIDLSRILTDGGYVVLAVPDKRYTFDYFREVTPFRDMLDVYLGGTVNSLARLAFDMAFSYHPVNEPALYSARKVSFADVVSDQERFDKALELYERVRDEGYVSSEHNWVFTYESFLDFMRDGLRARLLPYSLYYADNVAQGANEFTLILKKDAAILRTPNAAKARRLSSCAWRRKRALSIFERAVLDMVVHHACGLQMAVDYRAADEFEAQALHVLANLIGQRRGRGHFLLGFPVVYDGLAADIAP